MDNIEKNNILIADDESIHLNLLRGILKTDYNVYAVKNGELALELTDKYMPDLILLDIHMPEMDGFQVLEALKNSEKTKHIPVIIITGLGSIDDEENALSHNAVDFIYKPFSKNVVKLRVRNQIQIVNNIRAIKQYASKVEAIVNNYKGIIWSVDNEGVITSFNGQYLKKLGVSPSSMIGRSIQNSRPKDRLLNLVDNVERTFLTGSQDWQTEIDGKLYHSHTTVMRDDEGKVIGIVGSTDDITELTSLQRDLQAAVRAAEAANRSKSLFLAKMSHEIRTPLNAVLGIAEVRLQNETLQPDDKEAYSRIFNSGDLLLGIINDILDMSKIEAGKLELLPIKYDVASLINDTVFLSMIKHENKPIDFILNVDENVPSELFGDELRIKQILNNLLSNAFKYTREGEVELSISAEDSTLVFNVRDTGQGMTAEQISRVFEEYSRFNMEANRATEGTGLGMGIAQNLIRMMSGDIQVKSEPGKGSLFTVRLPQGNVGATPLGKETVDRLKQFRLIYEAKMEKLQIMREPIPFGKVLVVDDMEMNLYVTKGMLSPYGLQIDTASSGEEAIAKIKRSVSNKAGQYDLVFMDHMMPIMDGVEATREIKKLGKEYEKIPIIALTANAVSGMKEMFFSNGFSGFISKPVILQELDEVLKKWMSPEKITEYKKPDGQDTDETHDGFLREVGEIGEIDLSAALNQVTGNKAMYRSTLEIFHKKLTPVCDDMTGFLSAKDLNNFSISVHSMKSMLAIIGALSLSATALELEIASEKGEIDFCTQLFTEFKEKLFLLRKKLSVVFQNVNEKQDDADNVLENAKSSGAPKKQLNKKSRRNNTAQQSRTVQHSWTVLLVDDTEMILYVIKEKLKSYGLQVDTASSGQEAIEKVKSGNYDLVFMDHKMPKMNGIEAVKEIRNLGPKYKKLPIIALTAAVTSDIEEMFLAAGFNGFLSKPVENEKLEAILSVKRRPRK